MLMASFYHNRRRFMKNKIILIGMTVGILLTPAAGWCEVHDNTVVSSEVISTMKRVHINVEKNGNNSETVENVKRQAVSKVVNELKNPDAEYSSDFSDVVANYQEYIIATHVVDRDRLYIKVDVRSSAINDIIKSCHVRDLVKVAPVYEIVSNSVENTVSEEKVVESVEALVEDTGEILKEAKKIEVEDTSAVVSNDQDEKANNAIEGAQTERHKWAQQHEA